MCSSDLSLVDAISFGLAPAMIMYFAVLHKDGWDWLFVFGFTACAVIRLARFNVEQAGRAKTHFRGLPSPAAGGVLASYYWFSQTSLYTETAIGGLPWHILLRYLMALLAFLMVSDVPYPAWPTFSLRTLRGVIGLLGFLALAVGLVFLPREFFFPVGIGYVILGVATAVMNGLLDRGSRADFPQATEAPDDDDEPLAEPAELADELAAGDEPYPSRRRRRRRRRGRGGPHDQSPPQEPTA